MVVTFDQYRIGVKLIRRQSRSANNGRRIRDPLDIDDFPRHGLGKNPRVIVNEKHTGPAKATTIINIW